MADSDKPQAGLPLGEPEKWLDSTRKLTSLLCDGAERRMKRANAEAAGYEILADLGRFLVQAGKYLMDLEEDEGLDLSQPPGPPPGDADGGSILPDPRGPSPF